MNYMVDMDKQYRIYYRQHNDRWWHSHVHPLGSSEHEHYDRLFSSGDCWTKWGAIRKSKNYLRSLKNPKPSKTKERRGAVIVDMSKL